METQVPLANIPDGMQVELPAFSTELEPPPYPVPQPDDRQGSLPLTGVKPGTRWASKRSDADDEPRRADLVVEQLGLAWRGLYDHRGRQWTDLDRSTMREVELRCWDAVDVGQRHSLPAPLWFSGVVPRKLIPYIALLWCAYEAGAFGVCMTVCQLAAQLGVSERTIRNWRQESQQLGLARAIEGMRGKVDSPGSEQAESVLRIGIALEDLAGLAAFERGPLPRRPGITRKRAKAKGRELRSRGRRERFVGEGEAWRSSHRARRPRRTRRPEAPGIRRSGASPLRSAGSRSGCSGAPGAFGPTSGAASPRPLVADDSTRRRPLGEASGPPVVSPAARCRQRPVAAADNLGPGSRGGKKCQPPRPPAGGTRNVGGPPPGPPTSHVLATARAIPDTPPPDAGDTELQAKPPAGPRPRPEGDDGTAALARSSSVRSDAELALRAALEGSRIGGGVLDWLDLTPEQRAWRDLRRRWGK